MGDAAGYTVEHLATSLEIIKVIKNKKLPHVSYFILSMKSDYRDSDVLDIDECILWFLIMCKVWGIHVRDESGIKRDILCLCTFDSVEYRKLVNYSLPYMPEYFKGQISSGEDPHKLYKEFFEKKRFQYNLNRIHFHEELPEQSDSVMEVTRIFWNLQYIYSESILRNNASLFNEKPLEKWQLFYVMCYCSNMWDRCQDAFFREWTSNCENSLHELKSQALDTIECFFPHIRVEFLEDHPDGSQIADTPTHARMRSIASEPDTIIAMFSGYDRGLAHTTAFCLHQSEIIMGKRGLSGDFEYPDFLLMRGDRWSAGRNEMLVESLIDIAS